MVVLDSEHYYGLAAKHLADSQTYELLETDPSAEIVLRYHQYLERCVDDKILDEALLALRCSQVTSFFYAEKDLDIVTGAVKYCSKVICAPQGASACMCC